MSRKKSKYTSLRIILVVMILAIVIATGLVIKLCIDLATIEPGSAPAEPKSSVSLPFFKKGSKKETTPEEAEATEDPSAPPRVVASATIGAHGDLLIHRPIIRAAMKEDETYDFRPIFQYMKPIVSANDYAVANLETTFGGDQFIYQGNPAFNCPDELADAVKDTGYDMLLTANNHCNDTGIEGINRTIRVIRDKGLKAIGTRLGSDELRYEIVELNGIKIGMINYTYILGRNSRNKLLVNGENTPLTNDIQVNYYTEDDLNKLYGEMQEICNHMQTTDVDVKVLFIHWGQEYQLSPDPVQQVIAQNMCDMGIDLIVGGHPHVVQPMDVLVSKKDPNHKTVVIYSLGNAVSNQFVSEMTDQKTGHTEDGVYFTATFEQYSDGSVYIRDVQAMPTWVTRRISEDKTEFNIIPLDSDQKDQWAQKYNLGGETLSAAQASYTRTMDLVGYGLQKANQALQADKENREASAPEMEGAA